MLFTSPLFLYFVCFVLIIHALLPTGKPRKLFLLIASYGFYGAWEYPTGAYFLSLLIGSSFIDYCLGKQLYLLPRYKKKTRATILIASLGINLGLLITFKYLGFFATSFNDLNNLINTGLQVPVTNLILPLGISFFTFQSMSYTIDAYRRRARPYRSMLDFMLFVAFFPQLVAGPIVRAEQFRTQLIAPKKTGLCALDHGIRIVLVGLLLKVFLADNVSVQIDPMFEQISKLTPLDALFAVYGFTLQIFCDFAGYSLIAIGLARCMGFRLPRNFNTPYLSCNIRDFWKRWHITLSTWLRDYLYIPIGGSKFGLNRTIMSLLITMLLGGLWHGASWNFVIWGACHGALLAIEYILRHFGWDMMKLWKKSRSWRVIAWFLTFHFVVATWVFFRTETLEDSMLMFHLLAQVPSALINGGAMHFNSYAIIPFLGLFIIYHIISFKQLPEDKVLEFGPASAILFLVTGWLLVEIFYIGNVSFIYFAF